MNVQEQQRRQAAERLRNQASNKTKAEPKREQKKEEAAPVQPEKGLVKVYFSADSQSFYALNNHNEYQHYPKEGIQLLLRSRGYSSEHKLPNGLTFLQHEMLRIMMDHSVHFAGPMGGYKLGEHDMSGKRALATSNAKHIVPRKGDWPLFKDFLGKLLGKEARYFCGWMKSALESLEQGAPWSPGQLLAIAGPGDSGKSFFQTLITPMLGGRVSSPYKYMSGKSDFNAEIFGAEHALIGDENHKSDRGSRRAFGAAIKNLCVNPEQYVRGLYKGALTLSTFLRVSLTLNDNPQALLVLPEMDSDVADKIMLLRASKVDMPFPSKRFPTKHDYSNALREELPAFFWHLQRWKMPESIQHKRYGVVSYHSPELIAKLNSLSSEWKLWNLIEMYVFADRHTSEWNGTAAELQKLICDKAKSDQVGGLFHYPGACGQYLTALSAQMVGQILVKDGKHNRNNYTIYRDNPTKND